MKLTLAENIRAFRKERRLTQEQLAEVLGVTTGAVYKWESGLSAPELNLIVELADFFDTSVDVLLGYKMKDNRLAATLERVEAYCRTRNPEALVEAEKALKKYPNAFEIVHQCAAVYLTFAVGSHKNEQARRALELLEQARLMIAQNTNPKIGELTIYGEMAYAYILLGEQDRGIELLKRHNANLVFSDSIGSSLACLLNRPEEAEPFLSEALLQGLSIMLNSVCGYAFVFSARGDFHSARGILTWGLRLLLGIKNEAKSDSIDKFHAELLAMLAHAQMKTGAADEARDALREAASLARRFDAAPDYGVGAIRFAAIPENTSVCDILGVTAKESIETVLRLLKNPALSDLWREVNGDAE